MNVVRVVVRVLGSVLIVLGVLFWTGNALALIPVRMLLGILLVPSLRSPYWLRGPGSSPEWLRSGSPGV